MASLLINPRSGDGSTGELVAAARALGIATHVLTEHDDLEALARSTESGPLGMAGGDGSLAVVAGVAIDRGLPFACIPFGTRNHFARDLGLDRGDPIGALKALVDGAERQTDVGRANGRLFLNNVSLGVYARLVDRREHHRRRSDAFARLRAIAIAAMHRERIDITVDGKPVASRVVLVANNSYTVDVLSIGARHRLDEGYLYLYAPTGLLRASWAERRAERFTVDARPASLRAAVDGEPAMLDTPIEFVVEPGALRVLVPRGPLA